MSIEWYNVKRHRDNQEKTENRYNELLKNLQLNVFNAIYERKLSKTIVEAMHRDLLAGEFVCTRNLTELVIDSAPEDSSRVIVYVKTKRDIKNVSGRGADYCISSRFLAKQNSLQSPFLTEYTMFKAGIEPALRKEDLAKLIKEDTRGIKLSYKVRIELDDTVAVETEAMLIMSKNDFLPFINVLPTDKLTLRIQCRSKLNITVRALHTSPIVKEERVSNSLDEVYRIHGGLFPGHGVMLSWAAVD